MKACENMTENPKKMERRNVPSPKETPSVLDTRFGITRSSRGCVLTYTMRGKTTMLDLPWYSEMEAMRIKYYIEKEVIKSTAKHDRLISFEWLNIPTTVDPVFTPEILTNTHRKYDENFWYEMTRFIEDIRRLDERKKLLFDPEDNLLIINDDLPEIQSLNEKIKNEALTPSQKKSIKRLAQFVIYVNSGIIGSNYLLERLIGWKKGIGDEYCVFSSVWEATTKTRSYEIFTGTNKQSFTALSSIPVDAVTMEYTGNGCSIIQYMIHGKPILKIYTRVDDIKEIESYIGMIKSYECENGEHLEKIKRDPNYKKLNYIIGYSFNITARKDARQKIEGLGKNFQAIAKGKASITKEDAEKLIQLTVQQDLFYLEKKIPAFHQLPLDLKHIFVDMSYNMGTTEFWGFEGMIKAVNRGDLSTTLREMKNSDWFRDEQAKRRKLHHSYTLAQYVARL